MSTAVTPVAGMGTLFRRWNTTTHAWVNIARIQNINGPTKTRTTIDITSLDSAGGYREFIAGLRDPGGCSYKMFFTREGYELMNNDFESDVLQDYEIVLPDVDQTSFEFQGLVTDLPLTIPPDDAISADITIKISGQVTIGSGGSESPSA